MGRRRDALDSVLGPLEQEVMDVVWGIGDATVRDVHDELSSRRQIAYTTVMTTMSRLAQKGLLERDTSRVAHRYRPAISRDSHGRTTVGRILSWLFERYPEPAASYLADVVGDGEKVTLEDLREAVERRRDHES